VWTQRPNSSSSSLDRRTDGRSDRSPAARGHCRAWKPRGTHGERRPLCAPIRVTGSRLSVMAISRFLFGVLVACHSFGSRWPGGRSRTTQTCSNSAAIQSGHGASLPRICGVGMHCRAWKPRGTHGERRPLCEPIRVAGSRLSVMAISMFLFGVLVACHSFGSRWPGGRSRTTRTCSNSAAIQSGRKCANASTPNLGLGRPVSLPPGSAA